MRIPKTGSSLEVHSVPSLIAKRMEAEFVAAKQPGERLPTVADLAARYEVSKNSVVSAMEILARAGRITRRQGRGVFVAERNDRWRIGILSEANLFGPRMGRYHRFLVSELKSILEAAGAEVHLYMGTYESGAEPQEEPTCPRFWDDVAARQLDGAVVLNLPFSDAWVRRVDGCAIPVVGMMTQSMPRPDYGTMLAGAVRHLAEQGCRRLGLMAFIEDAPFRRAVDACGVTTSDKWIRTDLHPAVGGSGWEEFREIWLNSSERPDGLVILDDMLFADAQLAIFEMGVRVPQELKLMVLTTRGAPPRIRLPIANVEIDPAWEAEALAAELLGKLRGGETGSPVAAPAVQPFSQIKDHIVVEAAAAGRAGDATAVIAAGTPRARQ